MKLNYLNVKPLLINTKKKLFELKQLLKLLNEYKKFVKTYSLINLKKEKSRLKKLYKKHSEFIVKACPHLYLVEFCDFEWNDSIEQYYKICLHCGLEEKAIQDSKDSRRFGLFKILTSNNVNNIFENGLDNYIKIKEDIFK